MHASSTLHRMAIAAAILVCLERIAPAAEPPRSDAVVDLSLTVAGDLPCVWPAGMTPFAVVPTATFGRTGRHRDMLVIDEHTGTQWDAPAHFVPPPDSGLEGAGPMGAVTGEKVPAWQFCGEACVIDLSPQRDAAAAGESFLIGPEHVREWELAHRPLGPGDVVCFRTGYTDAYYRPFPAGDRFVSEALRKKAPGWAAPKPETMTYLADRGVTTLASDGASMGPLPNLAVATHQAGGRRGMVWVECATNLGSLPATGSFVAILAAKHAGGSGGECRMVAVTDPTLAAALIARARAHAVVDLSVTLDENLPAASPGRGVGNHRQPYQTLRFGMNPNIKVPFMYHLLDSHTGTHLVPPSYALPKPGFDPANHDPQTRMWLAEYEQQFGPRGFSTVTTEQVPLSQTCGTDRVVDVRGLRGHSQPTDWPSSPRITRQFLEAEEQRHGAFHAGEIVVFRANWSDEFYKPLPAGSRCFADPLDGKCEGWPALTAEGVLFLAERGIRCVGTDAPTLGGVDDREALFTYWALGTKGLVGIEYLTNLGDLKDGAYFLFAPVRIRDCHGGPGRAVAFD